MHTFPARLLAMTISMSAVNNIGITSSLLIRHLSLVICHLFPLRSPSLVPLIRHSSLVIYNSFRLVPSMLCSGYLQHWLISTSSPIPHYILLPASQPALDLISDLLRFSVFTFEISNVIPERVFRK